MGSSRTHFGRLQSESTEGTYDACCACCDWMETERMSTVIDKLAESGSAMMELCSCFYSADENSHAE